MMLNIIALHLALVICDFSHN